MQTISTTPKTPSNLVRLAAGLLALGLIASPRSGHTEDTPRTLVERMTNDVLAVLADKSFSTDQKKQKIEAIAVANMDFQTLARLTLARNWQPMNDAQKQAFVVEFKRHLSVTYGRNVESYNNEKVAIVGEREEQRGDWTIKTQIVRTRAQPINVDYRVRKFDSGWKIIDVVIEGVSLVSNFRSEFQDIISSKGVDELIRVLKDKNEKGEPISKS